MLSNNRTENRSYATKLHQQTSTFALDLSLIILPELLLFSSIRSLAFFLSLSALIKPYFLLLRNLRLIWLIKPSLFAV